MARSTSSLDSLSSPSPSPSPPPGIHKTTEHIPGLLPVPNPSYPTSDGLGSDSELSELTDKEQETHQIDSSIKIKGKRHTPGSSTSRLPYLRLPPQPRPRGSHASSAAATPVFSLALPSPLRGWGQWAERRLSSNVVGDEEEGMTSPPNAGNHGDQPIIDVDTDHGPSRNKRKRVEDHAPTVPYKRARSISAPLQFVGGDTPGQNNGSAQPNAPFSDPPGLASALNKHVKNGTLDMRLDDAEKWQDGKIQWLVARLQILFSDKGEYKRFLACRNSNAQMLLDIFQRLLDMLESPLPSFHRNLIVATQRLAGKSGLYPVCYELTDSDVTTIGDYSESAGGFSDIYKGTFRGRSVCLKTIRLDKKTQMEHLLKVCSKEAILWGQLSHPNVLPFYGIYRFKHRISFVAPWMEHGDVNEYLKKYPSANRVLLTSDIAQGLRFLHENGIIHGDLKGSNILVNESGRACLADFGISSISDKDILSWTTHSSAASKGGTVRWQAPELFDPQGDDDIHNTAASDIYAWSYVDYEIFAGHIPFSHISRDPAVMFRVSNGERPIRPPDSSPSWSAWGLTEYIWTLMQDCWRTNPTERPTIDQVLERLTPILPPDLRAPVDDSALSPARFREMACGGFNPDDMSVDVLASLLDAA